MKTSMQLNLERAFVAYLLHSRRDAIIQNVMQSYVRRYILAVVVLLLVTS